MIMQRIMGRVNVIDLPKLFHECQLKMEEFESFWKDRRSVQSELRTRNPASHVQFVECNRNSQPSYETTLWVLYLVWSIVHQIVRLLSSLFIGLRKVVVFESEKTPWWLYPDVKMLNLLSFLISPMCLIYFIPTSLANHWWYQIQVRNEEDYFSGGDPLMLVLRKTFDKALTIEALRELPSIWKMLLLRRLLVSTSEFSVHNHVFGAICHIPSGGERLSSCSAITISDGRPRTAVSMIISTNDFGSPYAYCRSHHVHRRHTVQVEKTFQL